MARAGSSTNRVDRHGPFDLVIAADGSVSELHAAATNVRSTPYGWGVLWFVHDDPDHMFTNARAIHQVVDSARHMLGFLPMGSGPHDDKPDVSMFWSIRADRVDRLATRRARQLARHDPWLRAEGRGDPRQPRRPRARRVHALPRRARCGHGTPTGSCFSATPLTRPVPSSARVQTSSLMDAITLAECIASASDVPTALAAYSTARKRCLNYYQFATRALDPVLPGRLAHPRLAPRSGVPDQSLATSDAPADGAAP